MKIFSRTFPQIFSAILCLISFGNALDLDQVRRDLKANMITSDSIEMSIRTTISSPLMSNPQTITAYLVKKGPEKIFAELKTPFSNQRTIVNGSRMKTIDLNTRKVQELPYDKEALNILSYANFNPLDSGEWTAPRLVSGNLYSIRGAQGTLYYDAQKKRIEKFEAENSLTEFAYDATNNLKTMTVRVSVQGLETIVVTEVQKLKSSREFPDKIFEF